MNSLDTRLVEDELRANPKFAPKLRWMLSQPNADVLMDKSAARAVLNEMNPLDYPASEGEWLTIRKRFNAIIRSIPKTINDSIKGLTLDQETRLLEAYAKGHVKVAALSDYPVESFDGLGQYAEIIGAVAGAAAAVYGAKLQSDAAKKIAKIKAAGEARNLDAQMSLARAQMALQAAQIKSIEEQTAALSAPKPPPTDIWAPTSSKIIMAQRGTPAYISQTSPPTEAYTPPQRTYSPSQTYVPPKQTYAPPQAPAAKRPATESAGKTVEYTLRPHDDVQAAPAERSESKVPAWAIPAAILTAAGAAYFTLRS